MNLHTLRQRVDRIDAELVRLLAQRTQLALEIGQLKAQQGQSIFSPEREQEVLAQIARLNRGPLPPRAIEAIFREIISSTRALEHPLRIAYLGPPETFTHQAARKKFGSQVEYVDCRSITEIFTEVEQARADYGVTPIENSIEGAVDHTLDMFIDSPLSICADILMDIHHHLLSRGPLRSIRTVYSKAEVFGQCRRWLESRLPGVELAEVSSTAQGAALAARRPRTAAIATELAAKHYGLSILARNIEDSSDNVTRFLVIGRTQTRPSRRDRTSIVCSLKDRVGALHDMLTPFKRRRINLTKIESRPSKRRAWEYYFFIDFFGHAEEPKVAQALRELKRRCAVLKVLGSYPTAS